jgi:hypothetical protein
MAAKGIKGAISKKESKNWWCTKLCPILF